MVTAASRTSRSATRRSIRSRPTPSPAMIMKNGGDGYTMFKDCKLTQDCVMLDNQVLISYIVDKLGGSVGKDYSEPYGAGRITIVEAK